MKIDKEDYRRLHFSRLFCDYIEGNKSTEPFYALRHRYENLKKNVSGYSFSGDRKAASKIIAKFNDQFPLDTKARKNLASLSDENTVTITTGQQVNLFGGPLYTVFKTLSVIYLAEKLTRDTGRNVVPVFWLADEDHDFDEIAGVALPDKQQLTKVVLPCDSCVRHAAGNILIDDTRFPDFRDKVYQLLPETDFSRDLKALLDRSYRSGITLNHAFGRLMVQMFSARGLILAGSNFPEAKKFTSDKFRIAIRKADDIRRDLSVLSDQIASSYHQQAQVQDSLIFWHDEELGRVRLVHNDGSWHRDPGLSLSTDELLTTLEQNPEHFSPNVFLRPVIQESLLPNAAYVGGPAEIAYYGQMKSLYDHFDQSGPFLAGRMSATIVEPTVKRLLKDLPYRYTDFAQRIEDLEQNYLRQHGDPDLDKQFTRWKEETEKLTDSMIRQIGISDPGLQNHSYAITKEYLKSIDKLRKKMVNSVRQKEEVQINRLRKVKNALFPNDRMQEREISFIYFMNKYGTDIWDRILEQMSDEESPSLFTSHYFINL